jgi:hypothetical protein
MEISERLYIVMGSIEFCVNAALLSPAFLSLIKNCSLYCETSPIFCVYMCFALRRARVDARVGGARSDRYLS